MITQCRCPNFRIQCNSRSAAGLVFRSLLALLIQVSPLRIEYFESTLSLEPVEIGCKYGHRTAQVAGRAIGVVVRAEIDAM